jgi:long-chain acyl-CoA synthetase
MSERSTLLSYFDDFERRGPETVFVHHRGLRTVRWSYERLVREAHAFAHELTERGIRHGDRVLLTGSNSPEWAAAFWGCCLIGAVVVPLDKGTTDEFARSVAQQTSARLLISDQRLSLELPTIPLQPASRQDASHAPSANITDDTIVEIIYTSGTTSEPKGVVLTHRNIVANLRPLEREIAKYLKWERFFHPIRFLNLVPLSHVFGQFMGLFVPQLLGGEVHFHESLNPSEIVRTTRKNRISVTVLVPRRNAAFWFPATLVVLPRRASTLRLEVLGVSLRRRDAQRADGGFLATARLCGVARVWHDRNRRVDLGQSPVQRQPRLDRTADARS